MSGEPEVAKPDLVTGKAICEEKRFFFQGKNVLGYFPVDAPEIPPQFEACYTILIAAPNGQQMPISKSVLLKDVKTVAEAYAAFDAAVKEDSEKTEEEVKKQMFRQAIGHVGAMPKGFGRMGPNGFPGRR